MKSLKILAVVVSVGALVVALSGIVGAQSGGQVCITLPFGTFCLPGGSQPGQGSQSCPGLPFPLPSFPGLDCGDFQQGYQILAISAAMHFYSPQGPTAITVPYGTSGIPVFIVNLPMNWPITIFLFDIILPYGGVPRFFQFNLSGFYPAGQWTGNAYAGDRGLEFMFAFVDNNANGIPDPGELTNYLMMQVF